MKIILFLLSFVFVSCVTANTGKRDLSGVNPQPELSSIDNQFKTCVSDCTAKGGLSFWCSDDCLKIAQKENTTIRVADYATCMYACERDAGCPKSRSGHWFDCPDQDQAECHAACIRG